jgi:hypothetical protein
MGRFIYKQAISLLTISAILSESTKLDDRVMLSSDDRAVELELMCLVMWLFYLEYASMV